MGEVYRGRDAKLHRDVALKILPPAFAGDPDRLMRFEREARTLASLNHPHIAAIYGLENDPSTASGQSALVMELVEGEDLSQRIDRGPVPVNEALAIARQIAEALEAAHDVGVIHRDLKPANVKVKEDGTVKVLDFGLAKAMTPGDASAAGDAAASPTMTSPALTQMGLILGTAAYMAPEQAKGKAVDRRADVWAFGVVLYEMLVGQRLFKGPDVSDTLAAVLTAEPDLSKLPASTPPQIRQLIARCLTKDKKERLDSMTAARLDIDAARHAPAGGAASQTGSQVSTLAMVLIVIGVLSGFLLAKFLSGLSTAPTRSSAPLVAEVSAPVEAISAFSHGFALSPDGEAVVFSARSATGVNQLWIRGLGATGAAPIPGTEDGKYPFWSPDSRQVAFFTPSKLRRVPVGGGESQTICDVVGSNVTGTWNANGEILYGAAARTLRIWKVAAAGGTPTALDALGDALNPVWLPDGKRILYAAMSIQPFIGTVTLAAVDGSSKKTIVKLDSVMTYVYAATGSYLLMNRNDVLAAQKLDLEAGALVGPIVTVAGLAGTPREWYSVSAGGDRLLAAVRQSPAEEGNPGDPWSKLQWVTREGRPLNVVGERAHYWTMELSPNNARVATNPSQDIWLIDTATGRRARATSDPGIEYAPIWSPDNAELLYRGTGTISRKRIDPDGPAVVLKDTRGAATDWASDGRILITRQSDEVTKINIWIYDLNTGSTSVWLGTPFNERHARFSPDRQWIAYASDSTGRYEIYLKRTDGSGNPIPISTAGGIHPQFRRDGRELYFLGPADAVIAVGLTATGASMTVGSPTRLFAIPLNDVAAEAYSPYAAAGDGQRFLLNVPDRPAPLFFVQGLDALVSRARQ